MTCTPMLVAMRQQYLLNIDHIKPQGNEYTTYDLKSDHHVEEKMS